MYTHPSHTGRAVVPVLDLVVSYPVLVAQLRAPASGVDACTAASCRAEPALCGRWPRAGEERTMNQSLLVRLIGFPATLIHGETLVLDRWRWIGSLLPKTRNGEKLIDIGCGRGAFTIGAALRGYASTGISWSEGDLNIARERARICKASLAEFKAVDIRDLGSVEEMKQKFDVAIFCEVIEHIMDDRKLMKDIAGCLKPGGRLLLTTPNLVYRSITSEDMGPFSECEDGSHVRRGYTKAMLEELCRTSNLLPNRISYVGGFLSQKTTALFRVLGSIHPIFGWIVTLPLRVVPLVLDRLVTTTMRWPYYCICLDAYKPRYPDHRVP